MECYAKSIQLKPDNAKARYNLGNAYFAQNMPEKAIAEYRRAIQAVPDYALAHNMLAAVFMRTGKIAEAITEYEKAVKIEPDNKDALAGLEKARQAQAGKAAISP
jgi:tetratricopeptide (TPR) repeat protein